MFDRIAPTYDRVNRILSLGADKAWRKITIKSLAIKDGDTVLDIATGTGDLAILSLSHGTCNIVGIDISREMTAIASRKSRDLGFARRALFVNGDAISMPLRDSAVNSAMVAFGIRNMTDVAGFFIELHRVLINEGRAAILEFSLPDPPLLRCLYLIYLKKILPLIGEIMSGDKAAYRYLAESVTNFTSPYELQPLMRLSGFEVISSRPLSLGIVHLFVLRKSKD